MLDKKAEPVNYEETILNDSIHFGNISICGKKFYTKLLFTEVGGNQALLKVIPQCLPQSDISMFVFDGENEDSLNQFKDVYQKFVNNSKITIVCVIGPSLNLSEWLQLCKLHKLKLRRIDKDYTNLQLLLNCLQVMYLEGSGEV